MDIFLVSWSPEDHVDELCKIIKDVNVVDVESRLVEYVVDAIEPTGWRALWKPDLLRNPPGALRLQHPKCADQEYIVDVLNVSLEKLEAEVRVVSFVTDFLRSIDKNPDKISGLTEQRKLFLDEDVSAGTRFNKDNDLVSKNDVALITRRKERKPSTSIIEAKMITNTVELPMLVQSAEFEKDASPMDCDETDLIISSKESSLAPNIFQINRENDSDTSPTEMESSSKKSVLPVTSTHICCCSSDKECLCMTKINTGSGIKSSNGVADAVCDGTILTVRLWELTPLVQQENDVLDITTTAEVIEQVRFFYHNIFYPWDPEAEYCCYDEGTITQRHQLYRQVSGVVPGLPAAVAAEMRRAVREAWTTLGAIQQVEEACGARRDCSELAACSVQRLLDLHRRLDALRERHEMLRDPIIRELSSHHRIANPGLASDSDVADAAGGDEGASAGRVWLVGRGLTAVQLLQHVQQVPDLLQQYYPQCSSWSSVLCSTMQTALDACSAGDVLLLLPGTHPLRGLGALGHGGGALHGVGVGVVLEGSHEAGDVMMHISGNDGQDAALSGACGLALRNLQLRPLRQQTAVLVQSGAVTLEQVTVQGGRAGILVTGTGDFRQQCSVTRCTVKECEQAGVECRGGASVRVEGCTLHGCHVGVKMESDAVVGVCNCEVVECGGAAVEVVWPHADDRDDAAEAVTPQQLLTSLLQEYSGAQLRGNARDLLLTFTSEEDTSPGR